MDGHKLKTLTDCMRNQRLGSGLGLVGRLKEHSYVHHAYQDMCSDFGILIVLVGCKMTFDVSDGLGQSFTSSLSALAVASSPVGANATRCWGGSYDR